jgi:hypothetical protein
LTSEDPKWVYSANSPEDIRIDACGLIADMSRVQALQGPEGVSHEGVHPLGKRGAGIQKRSGFTRRTHLRISGSTPVDNGLVVCALSTAATVILEEPVDDDTTKVLLPRRPIHPPDTIASAATQPDA